MSPYRSWFGTSTNNLNFNTIRRPELAYGSNYIATQSQREKESAVLRHYSDTLSVASSGSNESPASSD